MVVITRVQYTEEGKTITAGRCSANVLVRISVSEAHLMQPASTYSIMVCKSL